MREQNLLKVSSLRSVAATDASFRISQLLTNKKAFTDGSVVKGCIWTAASVLFTSGSERRYSSSEIQTAIDNIQLGTNTVSSELLVEDLLHQLLGDLSTCFSLALDESTDVTDLSQMFVFIRFVHDIIIKQDILALIPLLDATCGID